MERAVDNMKHSLHQEILRVLKEVNMNAVEATHKHSSLQETLKVHKSQLDNQSLAIQKQEVGVKGLDVKIDETLFRMNEGV